MNLLAQLIALLGLAEGASETEVIEAVKKLQTSASAEASLNKVAATLGVSNKEDEIIKAINSNKVDPAKYVGMTEYDGQNYFDTDHPVLVDDKAISVSNYFKPASNPVAPWYLLDTSRPIKPVIFQERRPYIDGLCLLHLQCFVVNKYVVLQVY